jgi:hypothetical protein
MLALGGLARNAETNHSKRVRRCRHDCPRHAIFIHPASASVFLMAAWMLALLDSPMNFAANWLERS